MNLPLLSRIALGLALAASGCVAPAPPPPTPTAPTGRADDAPLEERAGAAAVGLLGALDDARAWPQPRPPVALALSLSADDGFDDGLRAALEPALVGALAPRVALLASEDDLRRARALGGGAPAPSTWPATHLLRGVARPAPGGWQITWRLIELGSGRVLGSAESRVRRDELRRPPHHEDPLTATRALLAAARARDGGGVVARLHPELARAWARNAQAQGEDLEGYALAHLAPAAQGGLGPVIDMELKPGVSRAEVEVRFRRKLRDVDFVYRRTAAGWRLRALGDYP